MSINPKLQATVEQAMDEEFGICLLRVSSDRQFQEGDGIAIQKSSCDFYSRQHNIPILHYFREHFSGRSLKRDVIQEMIDFIKNCEFKITKLIIYDIERFTRGGSEFYLKLKRIFAELGVEIVDAQGIIQKPINTLEHLGVEYDWSVRSPSQVTEVVLAESANSGATTILSRCIGGQIQKARGGYQFKSADFGYKNQSMILENSKKATVLVIEEQEALWIRTMFDLRAEGLHSDQEICDKLNAMGFKTRSFYRYHPQTRQIIGTGGSKPLSVKQLLRFISRPVYCGLRIGKWIQGSPVKLVHCEPLVSIQTFNRANRSKVFIEEYNGEYSITENIRGYGNQIDTNEFALRHVVCCPQCNNFFLASKSRGKSGKHFGYYHCSRKHKYYGINQKEFESTVANAIQQITFKKKYLGLLKEAARDVWQRHQARNILTKKSIQKHIETLQLRQQGLLQTIQATQSEIVRLRLETDYEDLENQIITAKAELEQGTINQDKIQAYFQQLKFIMEHPDQWFLKPRRKEILKKNWAIVFKQYPTYENLTNGTPEFTLAFRLIRDSGKSKRQLVEQLSSQWNTFVDEIMESEWCWSNNIPQK